MKIKIIAFVTAVCFIISSILGGALVFAPPQTPLLPAPVEVVNPPDSSLKVSTPEGQPLNVTLDELIEVVNPTGTSLDVNLDEPINVTLDEPIEVTNSIGVPLNVTLDEPIDVVVINSNSKMNISGWLHTTQSGNQAWNTFESGANDGQLFIDTEGYREISIVFDSSDDSVVFGLAWEINNRFRWAEGWTFGNEKPPSYTTPFGTVPRYFSKTYVIQGEQLEIYWYASAGSLASGDLVSIDYYKTT